MFVTPPQGLSPETIGSGMPLSTPDFLVSNAARQLLSQFMDLEVEKGTVGQDAANWLLQVACGDVREAEKLFVRCTRQSGFNGPNEI